MFILNVLIVGGTGFIGKRLTEAFIQKGYHIYISTRTPNKYVATENITYISDQLDEKLLPNLDIIINLAGESLFGYWTEDKKRRILKSRINMTKRVVQLMKRMEQRPEVFLNASAIGFYGTSDEVIFTEKTKESGRDFLATVVKQWEQTAKQAENLNIRTIYARFGLVLGDQGALPLMALPIRLGIGGQIGTGEQYMSWVHIEDVIGMCLFAIENNLSGPLNITAPSPEQNKYFIKKLAQTLKRPAIFPTPKLLLETVLGEMSILITEGQYVLPRKAEQSGYSFNYQTLEKALQNIYC